jgi:predicted HicB family RNase H-like nuclease
MRQPITAARVQEFMSALGSGASDPARVFLVGGASAVLLGWRESTIDIDLKVIPERDELLRQFSVLKDRLEINLELASPDDFIPELPGWEDRSQFVCQVGRITFLHYDFYAQALAKIERGHDSDQRDVQEMIKNSLVDPNRLLEMFSRIEGELHRYPALDAASFRRSVEAIVNQSRKD